MKRAVVWLCVACASSLLGGCLVLPSAVWPSGEVHVRLAGGPDGAKPPPAKFRAVVVKYWYHEGVNDVPSGIQVLGVFVTDQPDFSVDYGPRGYALIFTPALGWQHLLPQPAVAVFADGYWPCHARFNYGRRFDDAEPRTGHVDLSLRLLPLDQTPPLNYAPDGHFPFSGQKIEDVEATLRWYPLDERDRQIVVRGMAKYLAASAR